MTYFLQLFIVLSACFIINDFVSGATRTPGVKFRRDYVYFEKFDSFIKINLKRKSWQDAKFYCEAEGASLAVIRTSSEASAIFKIYPKDVNEIWIGLQCFLTKGDFQTIDGESIDNVFGEWAPGEPSDSSGTEDCVAFDASGRLNDQNCNTKRPFLCKKHAATITPNPACGNFDLGYKRVLDGSECIKFHDKPKNWEEAYTTCNAEGSHLAIINSQAEADLFKSELEKRPIESLFGNFNKELILLGFHDMFEDGEYLTVDGKKLSESGYETWYPGQPDGRQGDDCGSMFRDGSLNDESCSTRALFICEKSAADVI